MQTRSILLCAALAVGSTGCAQQSAPIGPAPASVENVSTGKEVGAALRNRIQVNFAAGSDRLMPDAGEQLDIAARLFRDVRPVSMFATGYSDANGDEFSNLLLGARRARTVKAALVARGIPANQILLRSFGVSDPIDRADPGAAANRRVIVTWDIL